MTSSDPEAAGGVISSGLLHAHVGEPTDRRPVSKTGEKQVRLLPPVRVPHSPVRDGQLTIPKWRTHLSLGLRRRGTRADGENGITPRLHRGVPGSSPGRSTGRRPARAPGETERGPAWSTAPPSGGGDRRFESCRSDVSRLHGSTDRASGYEPEDSRFDSRVRLFGRLAPAVMGGGAAGAGGPRPHPRSPALRSILGSVEHSQARGDRDVRSAYLGLCFLQEIRYGLVRDRHDVDIAIERLLCLIPELAGLGR